MGERSDKYLVVRGFSFNEDYATIQQWWKAHGSYPPKLEHLPSTGIVVEADSEPACVGFLYKTDSKVCVFEFVVSNPQINKIDRDYALNTLIESAKVWASRSGFTLIYSSIGIKKYISRLLKAGFKKVDEGQTHLFYEVKNE